MNILEEEKKTITWMIRLWCKRRHNTREGLCPNCDKLNEYALSRLSNCRFAERKPVCEMCPVHCYEHNMREQIRQVMRFCGPRMLFHHPIAAIKHLRRKNAQHHT